MRSLALRFLVVLLSLALISGNARAELHLSAVQHHPCPTELGHNYGGVPHHHNSSADQTCCCDCLGCVSAIELTPDLTSHLPAFLASSVLYREESPFLAGQALRPEPGPPRPRALT